MNITNEEKQMYEVMRAIFESGITINFKGSMVLKACLLEMGYNQDTRHTVDIDGNWYTEELPSPEQMVDSLQKALSKKNIDLKVRMYRMYGEGRSAGFELFDENSQEILFTMDIDVNRPKVSTKIYEINGIKFCGVAPIQMLTDKITAVSSEKVFRRIKDVVDLYYLSNVFEFDIESVYSTLQRSGKSLSDFNGFLNRVDDLKHSYEKFRFAGDIYKPTFEQIYQTVKEYIKDALPK